MRTTSEIESELQRLVSEVQPLNIRVSRLRAERDEAMSREFIAVNRITRKDVQMSGGEGVPFFGVVTSFGDWMKANNNPKRWAEWNGRIYHSSDLMNHRMQDMPGLVEHIPAG